MRNLLAQVAKEMKIDVSEQLISIDDLNRADEVFVCNSVIKIWPVLKIEQRQYAIGPLTKRLMAAVRKVISDETNK